MVWSLAVAAASAFGVIFVAELGDKTQLLALGFGSRYGWRTVLIGLILGYAAAGAIAALAGGLLGATLPERALALVAGALFLVFAVLAVVDDEDDDDDDRVRGFASRNVVASIALTIAVAEMGDKTQIATAALASQANPVATWVGATGGEVAAGMLGALAGRRIGTRIDGRTIRLASAVLFAAVGVIVLVAAW